MQFRLAAGYSCLVIIPLLAEFLLDRFLKNRAVHLKDNYEYKCVFTDAKNIKCREHIDIGIACGPCCSQKILQDIVKYILSAKESISMCMYLLTLREITAALVACHKAGKQVRVILDDEMCGCSLSQGRILLRHGVPVKVQRKGEGLMHHKFCLIDENTDLAKLFIGSVNLTLQGICYNCDTFVFTNNNTAIITLTKEFNELWLNFKDKK